MLTDETMESRYHKVMKRMKEESFDVLIVYGDLEHGSNFEYLTGFLPRFEEALLVMHKDGSNYMIMGNENLNKVSSSRIKATPLHAPHFSLPNQPWRVEKILYLFYLRRKSARVCTSVLLVGNSLPACRK